MSKKEEVTNPWLNIPWQDYEGHMSSPEVRQAQFLREVFRDALREYVPEMLAVLGCSTGNGFEHIDPSITRQILGVDINPHYLDVLHQRYGSVLPKLELICADIAFLELESESCDLIYCGLIFEYVDRGDLIRKIARWLKPNGMMVVVLQLPKVNSTKVSKTEYESLKVLEPIIRLVQPDELESMCFEVGLSETRISIETLESEKAFYVGHFKKDPDREIDSLNRSRSSMT